MAVLSSREIRRLCGGQPPLVENYLNLETQLQPNGFDLTLLSVSMLENPGRITVDNRQRQISALSPLVFDHNGFLELLPGIYSISFNEIVNILPNLMAIATPRSSLLRAGVTINTAIWDAGYSGRSESLLVVYHPQGIRLEKNARVLQLIFMELTSETEGYNGTYQNENVNKA